jgi:hypothetical protein
MKTKLLKRLRKKYTKEFEEYKNSNDFTKEIFTFTTFSHDYTEKELINNEIKFHIRSNRLWYKLLTTITHKKE